MELGAAARREGVSAEWRGVFARWCWGWPGVFRRDQLRANAWMKPSQARSFQLESSQLHLDDERIWGRRGHVLG